MKHPINFHTLAKMSDESLLEKYNVNCEIVALHAMQDDTEDNPRYDLALSIVSQTHAELTRRKESTD